MSAGAAGPGAGCGVRADPRARAGTPGAEGRVRAGLDRSRGAGAGREVCRRARARRPPRPQRVIRGLVRFFGAEARWPPQGDPGSCARGMEGQGTHSKRRPSGSAAVGRGVEREGPGAASARVSARCLPQPCRGAHRSPGPQTAGKRQGVRGRGRACPGTPSSPRRVTRLSLGNRTSRFPHPKLYQRRPGR